MRPTYWIAAIALIGLTVAAGFIPRLAGHRMQVRTFFADAEGLRPGAPVRMAGVEVGTVRRVIVHPELRERPAEAVLNLNTPYELKIPRDAVVMVQTAGLFGDTYVEIKVTSANGTPIEDGGVLQSKETVRITPQQWLEAIQKLAKDKTTPSETTQQNPADRK